MPTVLSPNEWGARVNYDAWTDRFSPDDGVAFHHGGGSDYSAAREPYTVDKEIAKLKAWEAYHIDGRGWRGLAYGWAIGQTGTIYRARGFNRYGAHSGDVDGDGINNNDEVVPVLWIASGIHHVPTPAFHDSMTWLRKEVIEAKSPAAKKLWGHKEVNPPTRPTACPGPNGMAYVEANRFVTATVPVPSPGDQALAIAELESSIQRLEKAYAALEANTVQKGKPVVLKGFDPGG